jgi:hypothetical protein
MHAHMILRFLLSRFHEKKKKKKNKVIPIYPGCLYRFFSSLLCYNQQKKTIKTKVKQIIWQCIYKRQYTTVHHHSSSSFLHANMLIAQEKKDKRMVFFLHLSLSEFFTFYLVTSFSRQFFFFNQSLLQSLSEAMPATRANGILNIRQWLE